MLTQENVALIHKSIPLYAEKVRLESDIVNVMIDDSAELKERAERNQGMLKVIAQKVNIAFENHKKPEFEGRERILLIGMMSFVIREIEARQMISVAGHDNVVADVFNQKIEQRIKEIREMMADFKKDKIL
ncbi:hypothetical protein [Serratia sp. Se-RSBMAAmG]|uniref:hypothetical protein n=1 Tax=Serratia sp. Se-RSBMAAmG TaxID=3043305 RepID=UPI0024AFB991|nr:hypothetical protein [Serratia sp. Se-RSBMAAmG]MDI6977090.1 hypothetical protein [Serratia sp. Se-RSBMAAmG]